MRASPDWPASSARRARRAVSSTPGPPRARHHSSAGSQASGRLRGTSQASVNSSVRPGRLAQGDPRRQRMAAQPRLRVAALVEMGHECPPCGAAGQAFQPLFTQLLGHGTLRLLLEERRDRAVHRQQRPIQAGGGAGAPGATPRAAGPPGGTDRARIHAGPGCLRGSGAVGATATAAMAFMNAWRTAAPGSSSAAADAAAKRTSRTRHNSGRIKDARRIGRSLDGRAAYCTSPASAPRSRRALPAGPRARREDPRDGDHRSIRRQRRRGHEGPRRRHGRSLVAEQLAWDLTLDRVRSGACSASRWARSRTRVSSSRSSARSSMRCRPSSTRSSWSTSVAASMPNHLPGLRAG